MQFINFISISNPFLVLLLLLYSCIMVLVLIACCKQVLINRSIISTIKHGVVLSIAIALCLVFFNYSFKCVVQEESFISYLPDVQVVSAKIENTHACSFTYLDEKGILQNQQIGNSTWDFHTKSYLKEIAIDNDARIIFIPLELTT